MVGLSISATQIDFQLTMRLIHVTEVWVSRSLVQKGIVSETMAALGDSLE
jgi:hypothetical protein